MKKVIRGSQEAFTESEKINVALIRKRLRDSRMKVEEQTVGVRSHTDDSTGLYGRSDLSGAVDYYEAAVAAV